MNLEKLNELKSLISRFNAENAKYGTFYTMSDVRQYAKGCYTLTLRFDELMYSLDVYELFQWCDCSDVFFSINHYDNYTCIFLQ